jgi:hypothetical protein
VGRHLSLAVAQVGGIQPGESREDVVVRLLVLLEDAAARAAQVRGLS